MRYQVTQVGTPLVEAYKSQNPELIALIREAAIAFLKKGLEMQPQLLEQHLTNPELAQLSSEVSKIPVAQPQDLKVQISLNKDTLQLLEYFSQEELDKWIMLQDQAMTMDFWRQQLSLFDKIAESAVQVTQERLKSKGSLF